MWELGLTGLSSKPTLFEIIAAFTRAVNAGFGNDTITDFKSSQDQIQLFQDPQSVVEVGDNVVITVGTNTITLQGVQLSSLQADDFLILA